LSVASGTCDNSDCTIGTTGRCLLSHADLAACPHFHAAGEPVVVMDEVRAEVPEPTKSVARGSARTFHPGIELGLSDAAALMGGRYGHIIGVLGTTGVGKTTFLTSLYLMASRGVLSDDYRFAGSATLQGFEDRARGLREWVKGALHPHMVDHTVLADPRQPGLLHLALREVANARERFDLLLTDLPGEWTEHLIHDASYAGRLEFLRRADGIVLVVDGPVMLSNARHVELQGMRHLGDRLVNEVGISKDTPVVVLISKGDEIDMKEPAAAKDLVDYLNSLGLSARLTLAAAVSRTPDTVANGSGVFDTINAVITAVARSDQTKTAPDGGGGRRFQTFRHRV
jgi:hypothetical protein